MASVIFTVLIDSRPLYETIVHNVQSTPYHAASRETFLENFSSCYSYYHAPFFFDLGSLAEAEEERRAVVRIAGGKISEKYFP